MDIDSLSKLRERIPDLRMQALLNLDEIYLYSFHFIKESSSHKLVSLPGAIATLQILLGHYPHTTAFTNFMSHHQTQFKGMNQDQWMMFLQFCKNIEPDLSNYDMDSAWPVMLDDFVGHLRQKKQIHRPLTSSNPDVEMEGW